MLSPWCETVGGALSVVVAWCGPVSFGRCGWVTDVFGCALMGVDVPQMGVDGC
jgi:hypothetical protein